MSIRDTLGSITKDDVLAKIGLETKRSLADQFWPILATFAAGMVVGATFGLLFAPKRGVELRADIGERAGELKGRLARMRPRVEAAAADLLEGDEGRAGGRRNEGALGSPSDDFVSGGGRGY